MPPQNQDQFNTPSQVPPQKISNKKVYIFTLLQISITLIMFYMTWFIMFYGLATQLGGDSSDVAFLGYISILFYVFAVGFIGLTLFNILFSIQKIIRERKETHASVIFLFAISLFVGILAITAGLFIFSNRQKTVPSAQFDEPAKNIKNENVPENSSFNLDIYTSTTNKEKEIVEVENGEVKIRYIDTKGKLLYASKGHYLSGEKFYTPTPALYYDGSPILNNAMLGNNGYLVNWALSSDGLHYSFIIGHYPHYPMTPETNTHDLYVDGKKIKTEHKISPLSISSKKTSSSTNTFLYSATSSAWSLNGKPFQIEGKNFPISYLEMYTPGAGYVEIDGNTIYVYRTDKSYDDSQKKPQTPPNSFNSLNEEMSVIMDKISGIGSQNTAVQFKGKMVNNSDWKEIFLNGMGGSTSSSELVFDSSQFFILPPSIKPAQTIYGELFSVYFSQVALPGDYSASASIQGGDNQQVYDVMVTADVTLQVK